MIEVDFGFLYVLFKAAQEATLNREGEGTHISIDTARDLIRIAGMHPEPQVGEFYTGQLEAYIREAESADRPSSV